MGNKNPNPIKPNENIKKDPKDNIKNDPKDNINKNQKDKKEDIKCSFHCPHKSHQICSDSNRCKSLSQHTTSVLYDNHNFPCLHKDMWVLEVQITFISQHMSLYGEIISKSITEIKQHLKTKQNVFAEFAFLSLRDPKQNKNNHIQNFTNEKTMINYIQTLNFKEEDHFQECLTFINGMSDGLNLNWTKNKNALKSLIILTPQPIDFANILQQLFEEYAKRDIHIYVLKNFNEILNKNLELIDLNNLSESFIKHLDLLIYQLQKQRHIQTKQKIVWHDPNINQIDNSEFSNEINEFCGNYTIEKFIDYKNTSEYIKNSSGNLILITSGTNGEALVNLIHNSQKVLKS